MSEGYERQYNKIAREEWIKTLKTAGVCLLIICMMFVMSGMVYEACKQRDAAIAERDALQQQLDFHTCRVQFEPMPVPEQTNQSPTLIEDDADDIIIPPIEIDEAVPVTRSVGATPRSNKWPSVRARYVAEHPACEACGVTKALNVHHVQPFHEHPELELDPENLITLCRDCHFKIGHDPDGEGPLKPNWKAANPNVRRDAAKRLKSKTTVVP